MSVFDRPLAELSDDELRLAAGFAAQRRDELVAEGRSWLAGRLHDLAVLCAAERDRRAVLARQVDEGMAEAAGVCAGAARLLYPPGARRAQRRRPRL